MISHVFFRRFFLMWTILKSLLNTLLQHCFCFMFWVFFFAEGSPRRDLHSCIGRSHNHRTTREVSDLSYFEGYQVPFTEHYICEIHSCTVNVFCKLSRLFSIPSYMIYRLSVLQQVFELFAAWVAVNNTVANILIHVSWCTCVHISIGSKSRCENARSLGGICSVSIDAAKLLSKMVIPIYTALVMPVKSRCPHILAGE